MGCCSSSEEEEDRRPVLQDNAGHGHTAPASGVPSDAVARLQKSFDEAEAEESARKAGLLLKKEQQDRATRDALLGPAKKPKPVTIAAPPPIQAAPVLQVSSPAPAPVPDAAPKAPITSIALAPHTVDLAKSPIASPPPIVSPVSSPPVQAAPAVTDDTLIALAQKQIAEEKRKEQTLKQAESILAQVESEVSTDLLRRSEARVQKGMSKAEQILAETETMQSEADLQKQKRRSVKLMQRAEDILAETESEPRPATFHTPRRQPAAADPDFTPAALTPVTAPSPLPAATPATLAFAMTPAATPAAHVMPASAEPTPTSPMPTAIPAAVATDTAAPTASPAPGSPAPDTSNAHSNAASPALPADYDPEKYPKGKVLYDYAARSENELTLKVDDILRIWEDKGDDWSLGEINGRSGYFPGNYVQRIRVTKRLTLKKMASNKILELQAKTGLLDSEKPAQAEEDSSLV